MDRNQQLKLARLTKESAKEVSDALRGVSAELDHIESKDPDVIRLKRAILATGKVALEQEKFMQQLVRLLLSDPLDELTLRRLDFDPEGGGGNNA